MAKITEKVDFQNGEDSEFFSFLTRIVDCFNFFFIILHLQIIKTIQPKFSKTMKKYFLALLTLLPAISAGAQTADQFACGADVSWCSEMEADGKRFYNAAGEETEIMALMKQIGMNAIRLRVWVNPEKAYGAWCDKADVLAKARRAHQQGLSLLIDFHYSEYLSLSVIARALNVNASYLSSQFKKMTGSTVTEYINSTRIKHALPLLAQSNRSIEDIAASCGFDDMNYFARVFKKVQGISPSAYRKQ